MNKLFGFTIGLLMELSASITGVEIDTESGKCWINQVEYPIVGYGTYPLTGQDCTEAVEQAIQIGYRMFDTATYYQNFGGIAEAIKEKDRAQLYLISKVWVDEQSPEDLRKNLDATLAELNIEYLDAYFLHFPNSQMSIEKTLGAMNEFRMASKIRHIGLSNISANHLKRALEVGVPITWVQIEMHPHFCDFELIDLCRTHSVTVQAWAPLGRGRISHDPLLARIGQKYGKTPSQVAIKWIIQHGCIPLPGSKNETHMRENFNISDFALTEDEMSEIDNRAKGGVRERFTKETLGLDDEFDFSYEQCWPK